MQFLNTVRASFDASLLPGLSATASDRERPEYWFLKDHFTRLGATYHDVEYIYLMRLVGDRVVFLLDSTPRPGPLTEPLAEPGEVYLEADPPLIRLFSQNNLISSGPYTDKWGTFVSAMATITDTDGKILGVIGVDIDARYWYSQILLDLIPATLFIVTLWIFTLLMVDYFTRVSRHRDTLDYLAVVLNSTSDAIISLDRSGVVKSWNRGAGILFNISEKLALGCKLDTLVNLHPAIDPASTAALINHRYTLPSQNLILSITQTPILKNNLFQGCSLVVKDITVASLAQAEISSRNHRLEKLNSLMVDRELKMIELKNKIKKLRSRK